MTIKYFFKEFRINFLQITRFQRSTSISSTSIYSFSFVSRNLQHLYRALQDSTKRPQSHSEQREVAVPSTIPYCLRFPDSLAILCRSSAHRHFPPSPSFSLSHSVRSSVATEEGRGVLCRTRTSAAQSSWNVRVPSDFVAYTSLPAEIATISDVLRLALRDRTHTRTGTSGTHTSLHLSVYHSLVDTLCDTATVRESPLAFAATRGGKTEIENDGAAIRPVDRRERNWTSFRAELRSSPSSFSRLHRHGISSRISGIIFGDSSEETSSLIIGDFTTAAPVRGYLAENHFLEYSRKKLRAIVSQGFRTTC